MELKYVTNERVKKLAFDIDYNKKKRDILFKEIHELKLCMGILSERDDSRDTIKYIKNVINLKNNEYIELADINNTLINDLNQLQEECEHDYSLEKCDCGYHYYICKKCGHSYKEKMNKEQYNI